MIRHLEWDSRQFGLRIGRVDEPTLSDAAVRAIAGERDRFDCIYLLADASHAETAERAHQLGFRMVDVRVTLARALAARDPASDTDDAIRAAVASDLPRLEALAQVSYRSARFYFDRRFPPDRVDDMYRIWIRNELHHPSGVVLVADDAAGLAGYTSCTVRDGDAEIGLVAVAETSRGAGTGRALLARSLGWAAARGAQRITVVTQGRNVAALRLYEHAGFRVHRIAVWYHWWAA